MKILPGKVKRATETRVVGLRTKVIQETNRGIDKTQRTCKEKTKGYRNGENTLKDH